jgi:hypothetical protein
MPVGSAVLRRRFAARHTVIFGRMQQLKTSLGRIRRSAAETLHRYAVKARGQARRSARSVTLRLVVLASAPVDTHHHLQALAGCR